MNCKPGDLAIVVSARTTPENIGRIVEVVRVGTHLEIFKSIDGVQVTVDAEGMSLWVVRSRNQLMWRTDIGCELYFKELPVSDSYLRPVSGLPIEDEVTDDIKEPA